jgi:RimJ/RimL family protein N-acetyltransferase
MVLGRFDGIRGPQVRSEEEVSAQLRSFESGTLPGNQLHWAIRDCETHACVGALQATWRAGAVIEIGFRVADSHQRQGVASAALGQLVRELRHRFPDYKLIANPEHAISARVLEKCGFRPADPPYHSL